MIGPYELNQIYTGDSRLLSESIPDSSIDLIFTDPPYLKESLPLYGWLAKEAARVLKPGGFCLAMCGGSYLNQIFRMMDEHLTFFWKYEIVLQGWATGIVWTKSFPKTTITVRSKPLLAYSKGDSVPRTSTMSSFNGTGGDKRYHVWGQDEASTRYYIDCFSKVGDIVFDPFCGGGTTPAMAKLLSRQSLAFEEDEKAAATDRERVEIMTPFLPGLQPTQAELFSNGKI